MADTEPKRGWTDIVDEPMRGEIPNDLSLTILEARQIIHSISPSVFRRLEKLNKYTAGALVVITSVGGLDDQGQMISVDPPEPLLTDDPVLARLHQAAHETYEENRAGVQDIMAKGQMFLSSVPSYLKLARQEVEAMPESAARTEALRDLTILHNAITDVVCQPKGSPSVSGWGRG